MPYGCAMVLSDETQNSSDVLLEVSDLKVHFPIRQGILHSRTIGHVKAVDGVSFSLKRGETFSIVGESGCGKSTTAQAVLRMTPLTAGSIRFDGEDLTRLTQRQMRPFRRRIQMVYQDPFGSLNPRACVAELIGEPLRIHGLARDKSSYRSRIDELMSLVGLRPDMADRYPHEFSGGQRQRIGIARALALDPALLVCDEPVSALDVSIQAQIINLLMDLQNRLGLTYLFIAHDLSVVRHISDRIGVMYLGQMVEVAERDALFSSPSHPYTKALLDAVPRADPSNRGSGKAAPISGEIPSVRNPPPGCRFNPRCRFATEVCRVELPALRKISQSRWVACHHAGGSDELSGTTPVT